MHAFKSWLVMCVYISEVSILKCCTVTAQYGASWGSVFLQPNEQLCCAILWHYVKRKEIKTMNNINWMKLIEKKVAS